jgi:hypothetical protein
MCIARTLPSLASSPAVVELGNQRLNINPRTLHRIMNALSLQERKFDQRFIEKLLTLPTEEQKPLTAAFFKALGFQSYTCIDINENFDSIVMDLNFNLREKYKFFEQYDLVTNNGTGEHIFNQYMVFKNMHQLTKVGGVMLHVMPFVNWVNHGFFNFNPILYFDLAEANNYEILSMSFGDNSGLSEVFVDLHKSEYKASDNVTFIQSSKKNGLKKQVASLLGKKLKQKIYNIYSKAIVFTSASKLEKVPLSSAVKNIKSFNSTEPINLAIQKLLKVSPNISITVTLRKTCESDFQSPIQGKYFHKIDLIAGKSL